MKNIIKIINFDIKGMKVPLIIEIGILLFFVLQSVVGKSWIPTQIKFIPILAIVMTINLIVSIVKYAKGISSEEGRLLFLTDIKGWEYILSKYLEFALLSSILLLMAMIATIFNGSGYTVLLISGLGMIVGFTTALITITSFVTIYNCYFYKRGISILLTIVSLIVYGILLSIIQLICYFMLPRIYMIVGGFIEINTIDILINLVAIGLLGYFAVYHIDNKLDIV